MPAMNMLEIKPREFMAYCSRRLEIPGEKKNTIPKIMRTAMTPQTYWAIFFVRLWKRKLIFSSAKIIAHVEH